SGAPAAASSASTTACNDRGAPWPPRPCGKCTQASPASNRAWRNRIRSVVAGSCSASSAATCSRRLAASTAAGAAAVNAPQPSAPCLCGVQNHERAGGGSPQGITAGAPGDHGGGLRRAGAVHVHAALVAGEQTRPPPEGSGLRRSCLVERSLIIR